MSDANTPEPIASEDFQDNEENESPAVPEGLISLGVDLEDAGVTPEQFKEAFSGTSADQQG